MHKAIVNEQAIDLWHKDMYSLQMIGDYFGVTRQAVKKYLNKQGVDTSKAATAREVVCDYCGKAFKKPRAYARARRKNYCCPEHYYAVLANPDYVNSTWGRRKSRDMVRRCGFLLAPEHVVHHKDSNQKNDDSNNLLVFASNADHMRWHRLGGPDSGVSPVWP